MAPPEPVAGTVGFTLVADSLPTTSAFGLGPQVRSSALYPRRAAAVEKRSAKRGGYDTLGQC
jgi:hypothetical protein